MHSPPRQPPWVAKSDVRGVHWRTLRSSILALVLSATPLAAQRPPLPLDPLTDSERETALNIAKSDARVRSLIGDRGAVAYLELAVVKPADRDAVEDTAGKPLRIDRIAELIYSVPGPPAYGVHVLIDLQRSTVQSARRIETRPVRATGQNVLFSDEDFRRARDIAVRDERLRPLLDRPLEEYTAEFLPVVSADPRDPCYRGRCVEVLFRRGRIYLRQTTIVELNSGRVVGRRGTQ